MPPSTSFCLKFRSYGPALFVLVVFVLLEDLSVVIGVGLHFGARELDWVEFLARPKVLEGSGC